LGVQNGLGILLANLHRQLDRRPGSLVMLEGLAFYYIGYIIGGAIVVIIMGVF
jgi:hypothetical protein